MTCAGWSAETYLARPGPRRGPPGPLRFLALFVAGYALLHALYFLIPDALLRDAVYHWTIIVPGAVAINLLAPGEAVHGAGALLTSVRASLEVVRGCDGSGVAFLLVAAMAAFPSSWRRKLAGLAGALLLVYALNQARIVGLYFVAAYRNDWFVPLHVWFVPTLFVVLSALYFAAWAARAHVRPSAD
jgi:exosortase family protein XrtM